MKKKICVFCSSSDRIAEVYHQTADHLAELIVDNGDELIYGGSDVGLMRRLAKQVKSRGGNITGIIPQKIFDKNLANKELDRLVIAPDMQSRKRQLIQESDAFVVMPGGFGTIDELLDVITEKQLQYHDKPIVMINVDGFFNELTVFFQKLFDYHFAKQEYATLWFVSDTVEDAYTYIQHYKVSSMIDKWY